jgi:capsular polysaccharide biosynthesis protein
VLSFFTVKSGVEGREVVNGAKNVTTQKQNKPRIRASLFNIKIDMESQFYQINILKLLLKWKTHLAVIVVAAIVLSAIFSAPFFITPKYKSFAVVYPANISPYSDESETEQMLQVMQSREIIDSVINKFDLAKHYKIDTSYKYYYTTMMYEWSQNVSIGKTPYEGVEIDVLDKNPQMAADIVNSIIDFYNKKIKSLHEEKFYEVVTMYERSLAKKKAYIDSLENRFRELSTKYGLLDYESQSREVSRGYLGTVDGSSRINKKEVDRIKQNIEEKGGEALLLKELIENEAEAYTTLKQEYEKAYMDYDRQFSYTNVVTKPYPADKKAFPVRWLIVVISAMAAFFISFIVILILENFKGMSKNA